MGTFATLWQDHRTLMVFFLVLIVVIPFLVFYLSKARKEHPKGLIAAALSNMGERFGYYIMNSVLVLFICSKFGISDEWSALIFGVRAGAVHLLQVRHLRRVVGADLRGVLFPDLRPCLAGRYHRRPHAELQEDHHHGYHRDGHRLWLAVHPGVQCQRCQVLGVLPGHVCLAAHRLR